MKKKWASSLPSLSGPQLALQYCDSNYSVQFGEDWAALRLALLSEQKYGAMVNLFSRPEAVMADLSALHSADFLMMEESPGTDMTPTDSAPHRDMVTSLRSSTLSCYTFPRGDIRRFPSPRADLSGLLGYYLMDAASLLPVLALNVQPDHRVLDLCAAPGGKSLALLMQNCCFLAANDVSVSRTNRLRRVLQSYLPRHLCTEERVRVTSWDGTEWEEHGSYDRVLVDVPCTTDRHSLIETDNNIFIRSRSKERQTLPALQTALLLAGLHAVTPGGDVVYSTCTLSQLQNEFVVERALEVAASEYGIHASIQELRPFQEIFRKTFNFHEKCRIGELVLPHLTANFGPIYFCLLRRER